MEGYNVIEAGIVHHRKRNKFTEIQVGGHSSRDVYL